MQPIRRAFHRVFIFVFFFFINFAFYPSFDHIFRRDPQQSRTARVDGLDPGGVRRFLRRHPSDTVGK